jgi:hypothetical protein
MAEWYEDYLHSEDWQRTRLQKLLAANINEEWNVIQCEHAECGMFVPLLVLNVPPFGTDILAATRLVPF